MCRPAPFTSPVQPLWQKLLKKVKPNLVVHGAGGPSKILRDIYLAKLMPQYFGTIPLPKHLMNFNSANVFSCHKKLYFLKTELKCMPI